MNPADAIALVDALVARGIAPDKAAEVLGTVAGRMADRLLTPAEFAAAVGRSQRTVERWLADESVPVVKAGGQTVGVHFPTFLAVCTQFAQPRGAREPVRAGEIAARIASR